jgi:spermidine synthase
VVGVPALFMGFSFPTANAIIQNSFENVGRRAGLLYLFNTLGAVAGSWIVGFFLLPKFGMQNATTIVLIFSCLAVVPLLFFSGKVGLRRPLLAVPTATFVLVAVGLLSNWVGRPDHFMVQRSFKFNMNLKQWNIIRHVSEGINETAVVMETRFGRDRGSRTLYTNGHPMSGNSLFSQRYMRGCSHLPLLHLDQPKKVMVICFGVGSTIHSATLHPSVEKLELIDLSSNVLSLAGWFEATNKGVLRNSKLDIFVNDGRQHLRMGQGEDYDLVTLEPPPLQFAGVSSLYSYEFYQLVHRRLKEGGFLSQWLPIDHIKADVAVSMVRAFLDVFPNAILFHGVHYNFILLGQKQEGKIQLSLDDLKRRLAERPEVWKDLIETDIPDVTSFFGMFAGGSDHLDRVSKGSRRLSDNRPIMEYDQIQPSRLGVDLLAPLNAKVWCPTCFSRKAARDGLKDLKDYLKTMNTFYHADRYLTREAGDGTGKFEVALAPEGENRPNLVSIERLEELRKGYHYIKHFTDWVGMPVDIAKRKMEPK